MKICSHADECTALRCMHQEPHDSMGSCNMICIQADTVFRCIEYAPEELDLAEIFNGDLFQETDPNGLPADEPGAKLDAGKPLAGVLSDFSLALLAVADVGTFGAGKYSRGGWQSVPDGETRYFDAEWRHALNGRHADHDAESGLLHIAHQAWNTLARLELRLRREKQ